MNVEHFKYKYHYQRTDLPRYTLSGSISVDKQDYDWVVSRLEEGEKAKEEIDRLTAEIKRLESIIRCQRDWE